MNNNTIDKNSAETMIAAARHVCEGKVAFGAPKVEVCMVSPLAPIIANIINMDPVRNSLKGIKTRLLDGWKAMRKG